MFVLMEDDAVSLAHRMPRWVIRYPASGGTYVYGRERLGDY
jgi:hypothetical protein